MKGFFDRHKALIITVLSISVLLLLMINISLHPSNNQFAGTIIDLEHLAAEEEEPKEKSPMEEHPRETRERPNSSVRTHQAFNQEQEAREQNFDQRLNEIFERNSARQESRETASTDAEDGNSEISTNNQQQQERSDGDGTSTEESQHTGSLQNSSISFSLVGRSARSIPNPVYTCDVSGKIVVNITVNDQGEVIRTAVNRASSNSTNQCLMERALEYASQARFSPVPGRDSQIGTITYYFQD